MPPSIKDRLAHAWNAFNNNDKDPEDDYRLNYQYAGPQLIRPDKIPIRITNEKTIVVPILNRLAMDVAAVSLKHARVDENDNYLGDMDSDLSNCLNIEANLDQAATAFRQDIAMTLFDHGVAAIVPVDTSLNPNKTGGFDIKTLRVGEITAWYPQHVKVNLYNEKIGKRQEIVLPKKFIAIVENPLYSVMNEPNSTLKRLMHKLNLLDQIDEQNGSGKLNMIIQLPYVIKSEAREKQAEQRRTQIEMQLRESKYGIAYTDGTEKITQLNRPVENDLPRQVENLTDLLYSQLGLTKEIMDGTADEQVMLNYNNRTIKPIVKAISEAMTRTFLSKTARTQGQKIIFVKNPFELVPVNNLAEIADKFTRNEILTANEIRSVIGVRPSDDPKADKLVNSNMPQPPESEIPPVEAELAPEEGDY
mgnify:FL=1